MSWYQMGYEGLKQEEDRLASLGTPDRLWMPPETSREILFIDDLPFSIFEHNVKIDGSFRNWLTCLRGVEDEAPCCEILGTKSRYFAGYYTIVDLSEYTDKKGKTHKYQQKLLLAKARTLKKLKRKQEDRGSLVGCVFKATRNDEKSPTCGDDFEFVRKVEDLGSVFPHVSYRGRKLVDIWAKATDPEAVNRILKTFQVKAQEDGTPEAKLAPFNYMELLKPQSVKDMRLFLKGAQVETWDNERYSGPNSGTRTGADEGIPF